MSGPLQRASVEGTLRLPGGERLPTTSVVLNGGQFHALSRVDGSFAFHDVVPGVYTVDVLSPDFTFPQFKVDVSGKSGGIRALEFKYPGAARQAAAYPLVAEAYGRTPYFHVRRCSLIAAGLRASA